MLFILGWHPDAGGQPELYRVPTLFASVEACEEAGAIRAGELTQAHSETTGLRYSHHCEVVPKHQEFRDLLESNERAVQ